MGLGKKWSQEDLAYLNDKWGIASLTYMSKKLKRSPDAVKLKASRLGLGSYKDGDGELTLNQLICALGCKGSYGWMKQKLIANGMPVINSKIYSRTVLKVNLDEFWKWADSHKGVINWSKMEENILGKEPEWVAARRKLDFHNKAKYNRPWSKVEEQKLKIYVENKLTYQEIAERLDRTSLAVRRRCYELYLAFPKRVKRKPWFKEEIELALRLKENGYGYPEIAKQLGRSQGSIRGKIEWALHPEYASKRRDRRLAQKEANNGSN